MHSQSFIVLLALFSSSVVGSPRNPHFYRRAKLADGEVRSPCPALNALANHGHLPRNGKNITADQLTSSIQTIYNVDMAMGWFLGHSAIPAVSPNPWTATSLDLDQLNKHDAIEHDASLSRRDFAEGDNHSRQPDLIDALLNDGEGDYLTVASLAKSRARRERESQGKGAKALSYTAQTLAYGEAALLLQAMGVNDTTGNLRAPKAAVKTWFKDEKLPAGYVKPVTPIGFSTTSTLATNIQNMAKALKGPGT